MNELDPADTLDLAIRERLTLLELRASDLERLSSLIALGVLVALVLSIATARKVTR